MRDVVLFLQGRNHELLPRLEEKMLRASGEENFEMAAAYRDAIRTVEDVADNIDRIADLSTSKVYRTSSEEVAAVVGS